MNTLDNHSCFCLRCYYPLTGLAENRCPECGREFDPDDPRTWWNGKRSWVRLLLRFLFHPILLLAAGWGIHLYFARHYVPTLPPDYSAFWYVSGTMAVLGLILLIRKRWSASALLVLNPVCLYFMLGAFGYFSGTGTVSIPDPCPDCSTIPLLDTLEGTRYERYSRLPIENFVESQFLNDWFEPHCCHLAISTLGKWLGPARGAYDGPLPTMDESIQLVSEGERISLQELQKNKITLESVTYSLPPAEPSVEPSDPCEKCWHWDSILSDFPEEFLHPVACVLENRCLLICYSINWESQKDSTQDKENGMSLEVDQAFYLLDEFKIYVIDIKTGKILGRYYCFDHPYPDIGRD